MRQLSSDMLQALFAGETGEAILGLVTIEEDSLSEPIRVTSDGVSTWSADQDSDTAADATGNGNDGTLVNGPTWTSDGPTDAIRGALSFDGVDDYAAVGDISALQFSSTSYTVEVWARRLSTQPDSTVGFLGNATFQTGGYQLGYNSGNFRAFQWNGSSIYAQQTSWPADEWVHFAWVFDAGDSEGRLYKNGTLEGTESSADIEESTDPFEMGRGTQGGWTETLDGKLADVRVWNTARTQTQIQDNMNKRLTGDESGLVGYWPLDDTTNEFLPCPFRFSFPDQSDEGEIQAQLEIDNVDRQITKAVRNATGTPTVTTQLVLASTPDTIEAEFPDFELTNVRYDKLVVEGTLTVESMTSLPFPAHTFDPQKFPNLF